MAAGQFTMTAEEMRAFSGSIDEVNGQIQGELKKLEALVDSITKGWQGEAAKAYHNLQHQWNEDAGALNKVLGEIKSAIDATAKQYAATEEDQRSSISKVAGT
ncbi:WXG100 family type VII secretion target [Kitasatospora sp. MAP12-15]|uniref:WXG100 family type VII secretion target n=1 Tax=unclassified Kitasatospora TaxID=2633591 RepID=UPI0024765435|nr:WXG100 family type VII secretion target [Kitasatospora sp. MAP12-44]MDH6113187.1 WXG100 family type VII secretion target [Kitasatospora sp. MAP12-44]